MVDMSLLYAIVVPSFVVAVREAASMLTTSPLSPSRNLSSGSVAAMDLKMPPVPPLAGKRNVALGPQPPDVLPITTFRTTVLTSGAATRSPSQPHCICASVSEASCTDSAPPRHLQFPPERPTP